MRLRPSATLRPSARLLAIWLAALLTACQASMTEVLDIGTGQAGSGPRFADNDPHEWDAAYPAPWDYPIHGIDVSWYQAAIDWPAVRRAGFARAPGEPFPSPPGRPSRSLPT